MLRRFKMVEILKNATIVYNDGVKEQFDAIYVTDKNVITGRIFKEGGKEEFINYGFISKRNIKFIYNGSKKKLKRMKS